MKLKPLIRKILNRIYYSFCSLHDDLLDFLKDDEEVRAFNQEIKDKLAEFSEREAKYSNLMTKFQALVKEQKIIQDYKKSPQKGALDGKYRNQLGDELMTCEEEKLLILEEIFHLGMFPLFNVNGVSIGIEELILQMRDNLNAIHNRSGLRLVKDEEAADE